MKGIDIVASFELEINKLDNTLEKPVTDDSLYWINQGIVKFTKDRFNGNAPKRTSYEQNEKRSRDLIGLLREVVYNPGEYYSFRQSLRPIEINITQQDDSVTIEDCFIIQRQDIVDDCKMEYTGVVDTFQYAIVETLTGITTDIFSSGTFNVVKNLSKTLTKKDKLVVIPTGEPAIGKRIIVSQKSNTLIADTTSHVNYNQYSIKYPVQDPLMFVLNEDVVISDNNGRNLMDTCVFECTADSFMYRVNNSLTDFHYRHHRARPLRVRTTDGCRLLTDKNYKINSYTLGYLKVPEEITSDDPMKDYLDFADYTWYEIVKIAAQMYVENQQDQRYQTITNEVLTQE